MDEGQRLLLTTAEEQELLGVNAPGAMHCIHPAGEWSVLHELYIPGPGTSEENVLDRLKKRVDERRKDPLLRDWIASRNLGVSQPSLHRAARELEQLLAIPLFEKTSTGINTTKACQALARAVKLAFAEVRQGYYEISALRSREVGKIVLGSMPLARTSILPEVLNRFSEKHPDIGINVVDAPYTDLLHHLRHGDLDLLVGALRFPPPADDILQEELLAPPLAIVARKNHPLMSSSQLDIATLAEYPWVVPSSGTPTRAFFDSLFVDKGLPTPHRLVETSSQILIRELLGGSDRLTLISTHQIEHELRLGLLGVEAVQVQVGLPGKAPGAQLLHGCPRGRQLIVEGRLDVPVKEVFAHA